MTDKQVVISAEVWKTMAESYFKLWQEAEQATKAVRQLNEAFDGYYMDLDDD